MSKQLRVASYELRVTHKLMIASLPCPGSLLKNSPLCLNLTSAAEADVPSRSLIAALKRSATQKQMCNRVSSKPASNAQLGWPA